jgi:hypothetical protein
MAGPDRAAAMAFAQAATTPPVIVRTHDAPERPAAPLAGIDCDLPLELRLRPFGEGAVMATLVNRADGPADFTLRLPALAPRRATAVAATGEEIAGEVRLSAGAVAGTVPARGVLRVRLDL